MKSFLSLTITFLWLILAPWASFADQASVPEILHKMRENISRVGTMTCIFKQEVVKAGKAIPAAQMEMKYLQEPETIFLEFLTPNKGQKCLYVKGGNQDKMLVRPSGFMGFMTLKLDPAGETAMKESLDPITGMGFNAVLDTFEAFYRTALSSKQYGTAFVMDVQEDGKPLHLLKIDSNQESGNYLHLYIDRESYLPYKVRYKKEKDLATYTYRNLSTNGELDKKAFEI